MAKTRSNSAGAFEAFKFDQGRLALCGILAHRLTGFACITGGVHQIVGDLKGEAKIEPERPQRGPLIGRAAYVILYDGVPVENPYLTQLLSAPLQIVRGRLPTTLLFVWGYVGETELATAEARATDWLRSALRNYREICAP